ncbi:amidohydrolase family protein [Auraticoccus sp. F435]|uniref:Amidohydrolase family protein n=1 Tax=Auraticoccus cholistanensis TaxID=2656650 RepID=A0A6A9V1Y8_9ACTN|nr:amidohydrolase family protein [Auraticoccus cholistanensis]MVA77636.1 amidohydrolase family protein [Auraticoccus cholistanensis]
MTTSAHPATPPPTLLRDVLLPGAATTRDLLLREGRVAAVLASGEDPGPVEVVDGGGRWALPGFVDAHVHGEAAVLDPEVQLAMLRQGVTTVVLGQDGVSLAPSPTYAPHDATAWAQQYFAAINGAHPTFTGGGVGELLASWDGRTALNTAYLAPHGTIRVAVMGTEQREAAPGEVAAMAALLEQALADGACGLSTGLEYAPASAATREELLALCRVVAAAGLPHVSHMRGYEAQATAGLQELVELTLASGVTTHVSHLHGPRRQVEAALAHAAAAGVELSFDSYPYLSGCSILSMVALPRWVPTADPDHALAVLAPAAGGTARRDELLAHLEASTELWPRVRLAAVPGELSWTEGLSPVEVADRLGCSTAEAVLRLLVSSRLRATVVFRQPPTNTPEAVRALLDSPRHLGGSDAIYLGSSPHPRGWGAFARMVALGLHELGGWDARDVVEHLSARAARLFRLGPRGHLEPGAVADVVLLDPERVRDLATYRSPRQLAEGVDDVWVGGVPVLRDGRLTGATPGRAIRPTSPSATSPSPTSPSATTGRPAQEAAR